MAITKDCVINKKKKGRKKKTFLSRCYLEGMKIQISDRHNDFFLVLQGCNVVSFNT